MAKIRVSTWTKAILDGMADAIWIHAVNWQGGTRPKATPAAKEAAGELGELYESSNDKTLAEIAHEQIEEDPEAFGRRLAFAALDIGATRGLTPRQTMTSAGISVPTFSVTLKRGLLTWEGSAEPRRNPFGYRVPTDEELASAWRYIENEYTLAEGNVDGEQWAEGLAFGRPLGALAKVDPIEYQDLMAAARGARPQLTEEQWSMIAARADHLRVDQGEVAKFRTTTKNTSVEQDLGINPHHRRQWLPSMVEDDRPPAHDWPRSEVQSLLFSVDHFSAHQAKEWAKQHGFRYGMVDTTEHYHRLRQFDPTGAPCRTMDLPGSHPVVRAVVCRASK